MTCVVELVLQPAHLASLLGADGGALQRLASASGARAGALLEDGTARVRLAGQPSACACAEIALWRAAGDEACDAAGWFYLSPHGSVHGPHDTSKLVAWWRAGHWRPDVPVRNGASTAWLRVGALLHGFASTGAPDDSMDVDSAATDALASWRNEDSAAQPQEVSDLTMLEAVPPAADAVRLVVDTCVLLTRLPQLQRAADALRGHAFAVVPWTAVCELDGLKSSADAGVARLARDAIRGLAAALSAGGDAFFRGESAAEWRAAVEVADSGAPGGRGSADDRILATALRLRADGKRVMLVTNDANLRLKALVNGLPACTDTGVPASPAALAAAATAPPPPLPPPLLLRGPSEPAVLDGRAEAMSVAVMMPPPTLDAAAAPAATCVAQGAVPQVIEPLNLEAFELMRDAAHEDAARAALPRPQQHLASPLLRSFDAPAAADTALATLARGAAPVLGAMLLAEYGAGWLALMELPATMNGRDILRTLDKHWRSCFAERLPGRARASAAAATEALRALGRRGSSEPERQKMACDLCVAVSELLGALPADASDAGPLAAARADAASLLRSLHQPG